MTSQAAVKSVLESTVPQLSFVFAGKEVANKAYATRAEATPQPTLVWSGKPAESVKKYLHVNIDLDAPFQTVPFLAPILHFVQKDLVVGSNGIMESPTAPVVDWIKPGPPPGSGPHRYVSILYEQPDNFNADGSVFPEGGVPRMARMRFDFASFETKAGLGKPVAGGYFTSN